MLDALLATPIRDDAALAANGRAWASGAPLWMLIARVASLVPVGDVDFRMRLLAAACAGLAVFATGRLATQAGRAGRRGVAASAKRERSDAGATPTPAENQEDSAAHWGGITAAALLAVALVFERHATAIDVAPAAIAALAGAALLIERLATASDRRIGLGLGLALGLGLGLAPAFVWIVPIGVVLAIVRLRGTTRVAALALLAAAAGAIWLSALLRPAGAPAAVASASFDTLAERTADSLGPLAALAALAGALVLARGRRAWIAIALVAVSAGDVGWAHARGGDAVALVWAAAAAAGVGAATLVRLTGRFAPAAGAGVAALCVLPAAILCFL